MYKKQSLLTDKVKVSCISLDQFEHLWQQNQNQWLKSGPFVTPAWLRAWWSCFRKENKLLLLCVARDSDVLGVAPCMVHGNTARLIGSGDVCDYLDILVLSGHSELVLSALFSYFEENNITELILKSVRTDSSVMNRLVPFARNNGCKIEIQPINVSVKMKLPGSWDEYLAALSKKQRHEVRRKFRRLYEAGAVTTRIIKEIDEAAPAMDRFLSMFRGSRKDKDSFMTAEREVFFRELAQHLARCSMLNVLEISINCKTAAMVFCVHLGSTTYLYNNGFNPDYSSVSIGAVSKLMTIRQSIERGMQDYDFLGGNEHYKSQLGGVEETLYSCSINMGNTVRSTGLC